VKKTKRTANERPTDTSSIVVEQCHTQNKPKRAGRIPSAGHGPTGVSMPMKRTKKAPSKFIQVEQQRTSNVSMCWFVVEFQDKSVEPKANRCRTDRQPLTSPVDASRPDGYSPIYATIQRDRSFDRTSSTTVPIEPIAVHTPVSNGNGHVTPKPSTFKRIQSFFRATPSKHCDVDGRSDSTGHILALTGSNRINRVVQVKTTTVAFGSSTPTNRLVPTSIVVKTAVPMATSAVGKTSPIKSKYNLRTRIFHNPSDNDKNVSEVMPNIVERHTSTVNPCCSLE
jgi:hypothetical protein